MHNCNFAAGKNVEISKKNKRGEKRMDTKTHFKGKTGEGAEKKGVDFRENTGRATRIWRGATTEVGVRRIVG